MWKRPFANLIRATLLLGTLSPFVIRDFSTCAEGGCVFSPRDICWNPITGEVEEGYRNDWH